MKKALLIMLIIFCLFSFGGVKEGVNNNLGKTFINITEDVNGVVLDMKDIFNEPLINEKLLPLLAKYPDFAEIVKRANINIPIFDEMIVQGITLMDDYILITAYDNKNIELSKCYVLNKRGEIVNTVSLESNSHVGGITYDKNNKFIWIPGNEGVLNAYKSVDFLTIQNVLPVYQFNDVSENLKNYQDSSKKEIAYLCIYNNYLYIGSFSYKGKGLVKQYEIRGENGEIDLNIVNEFFVPSQVQGISFFQYDNDDYLILSKSFGRNNTSYLQVYEYVNDIKDYTLSDIKSVSFKLPPMLEQITVDGNNLYALYESSALKYKDCLDKIEDICILDLKKIISKILLS